jgi:hypothetical protein
MCGRAVRSDSENSCVGLMYALTQKARHSELRRVGKEKKKKQSTKTNLSHVLGVRTRPAPGKDPCSPTRRAPNSRRT